LPSTALYRKYRSQTFGDLVGQEHVVRTLQNSLAAGTVAHAYLFTGPRGTGKTSTARLLAKAVNCERGPAAEPCNECEACRSIIEARSMDVVEIDAASESSVQNVRSSVIEAVEYRPASLRYKVYIIDEVHDLSAKAFDALLKTIEEPPAHVLFILATTEVHKVPATIRSRCLRFEFHRGSAQDIVGRLRKVADAEGIQASDAVLARIARMADGGYRDALSLLELVWLASGDNIEEEHVLRQIGAPPEAEIDDLLRRCATGDSAGLVAALDRLFRRGVDPRTVASSIVERLSELTRASFGVWHEAEPSAAAAAAATAAEIGPGRMQALRVAATEASLALRDASLPRAWLEARLLAVASAQAAAPPSAAERPAIGTAPAVPRPAEVPKAAPRPTGDPELDRYNEIWQRAYAKLSEASKLAAARLENVTVRRLENGVAVIEFLRTLDHDFVQDSASRQGLVRSAWAEAGGEGVELVFAVAAPELRPVPEVATTTVESRLRGAELADEAERMLGRGSQEPK
jgi:DNA polymerase-3 subunit gamma/tau